MNSNHLPPSTRIRNAIGRSTGFTVIELLVVMLVISILMSLLVPAVQEARASARRIECMNKLRQIGLALHEFEATYHQFPEGKVDWRKNPKRAEMSWMVSILPYCEQATLWQESMNAFDFIPFPYMNPPHRGLAQPVPLYACPDDSRVFSAQSAPTLNGALVGLTNYLGVNGRDHHSDDGMMIYGKAVRTADVTDGLSNTLCVGERPPSADFNLGWWYTESGQDGEGNADLILGTREQLAAPMFSTIPEECPTPVGIKAGQLNDMCDSLHFWSLHRNGTHFLLGDGSVRFCSYEAADVVDKMATRSGSEQSGDF